MNSFVVVFSEHLEVEGSRMKETFLMLYKALFYHPNSHGAKLLINNENKFLTNEGRATHQFTG